MGKLVVMTTSLARIHPLIRADETGILPLLDLRGARFFADEPAGTHEILRHRQQVLARVKDVLLLEADRAGGGEGEGYFLGI